MQRNITFRTFQPEIFSALISKRVQSWEKKQNRSSIRYHTEFAAPKKEGICDKCGSELVLRDDDKPETVQKRLEVYHEQTHPLIDYYKKKGVLHAIDGTLSMETVFKNIVDILGA